MERGATVHITINNLVRPVAGAATGSVRPDPGALRHQLLEVCSVPSMVSRSRV
jgi:hypothetical protein